MDIKKLDTEKRNMNTMNLDTYDAYEICKAMNDEDKNIPVAIEKNLESISKVVDEAAKVVKNGGRIIYIGAGTSGRIGLLDAVECPPTFGVGYDLVMGLIAGGEKAFIKAQEGAEDSKQLAIDDLKNEKLNEKDIVIGIAASGRTPYVIGGLEYAKSVGAKTASIAITADSEIKKYADLPIEVVVGPEVLTGSTRLKAGTAQKMIVNMISTGAMVLNGKVYQNLMVDVKQSNEKLVQRAINIVVEATSCDEDLARKSLEESNGNAKEAIVMILLLVDNTQAKKLLEESGGFVRKINNI